MEYLKYFLVAREWCDSLNHPVFWRKYVMVVSPDNCEEIAHCRRIKVVEFIRVGNFENYESHQTAVRACLSQISRMEDLAVKSLKFSGYKFGVKVSLPLELQSLHQLTQRVASLDLSMVNLSTAELEVLLRALSVTTTCDCQTVRRTLNIRKSSLAEISLTPQQLAEVVVNQLDELNMSGTSPSEEQVTAVLRQILTTTTSGRLTSLTIGCNLSLAQVEPALLARAVTRLSQVNLSGCGLSCHQVEAVL